MSEYSDKVLFPKFFFCLAALHPIIFFNLLVNDFALLVIIKIFFSLNSDKISLLSVKLILIINR